MSKPDQTELLPCPFCGGSLKRSGMWLCHPDNDCALRSFEFAETEAAAWNRRAVPALVQPEPIPKLSVWFDAMPESNGKANWTAILHRGDLSSGHTIDRSEHHDRVRYAADRVRWLIGELPDEPDILAYDENMLNPEGWTHPCGVATPQPGQENDRA